MDVAILSTVMLYKDNYHPMLGCTVLGCLIMIIVF